MRILPSSEPVSTTALPSSEEETIISTSQFDTHLIVDYTVSIMATKPVINHSQPLTVEILRRELHAALDAYHETAKRDLNDRFSHWDKKNEMRHAEILKQLINLVDRGCLTVVG